MPQCEGTVTNTKSDNFGNQCRRHAVTGSKYCERHGGLDDTTSPDRVRKRRDRPAVRCTATSNDGKRCEKWAIAGGIVCATHGGSAPQVRRVAKETLLAMQADALQNVHDTILDPTVDAATRLRASVVVLDRTGLGPKSEVSVEMKPYEQILERIFKPRDKHRVVEAAVEVAGDEFGEDDVEEAGTYSAVRPAPLALPPAPAARPARPTSIDPPPRIW